MREVGLGVGVSEWLPVVKVLVEPHPLQPRRLEPGRPGVREPAVVRRV